MVEGRGREKSCTESILPINYLMVKGKKKEFLYLLLLLLFICGCGEKLKSKKPGDRFTISVRVKETEVSGNSVQIKVQILNGGYRNVMFTTQDLFAARNLGEVMERNSMAELMVELLADGNFRGIQVLTNEKSGGDPLQKTLQNLLNNISSFFTLLGKKLGLS
ncbi:hypothetical protein ACFL35_20745 [Candidatus Riflebacteria bacterium]